MDFCSLTRLVLSFSMLSFIVSYSTSYSCLIYSFKYYLSSLISHILDKNFIFLIFNGILVFLAKTSGFVIISNASPEPNDLMSTQYRADEEYRYLNCVLEKKEIVVEPEVELKREETRNVENVQDVDEYGLDLMTVDSQEEKNEEDDSELLSSEDLNKKFDDFIRRMKEDFKSGTFVAA